RQLAFWKSFIAKLRRKFADRFAVTNRNRMHPHKRLVTFFDRRTLNGDAVDWIRSIEDDNVKSALLARVHAEVERPDESVITRADVLKIDKENVEILQHFVGRFAMFAVQTVNRNVQPRMLVAFPFDHVVLGLTEESVLRSEERAYSKQFAVEFLENARGVFKRRRNRSRMQ